MKVAVIGSRGLSVASLGDYLPNETTEIVSGGACGIDSCARAYAFSHHMRITELLPQYALYGRSAPLKRNMEIVEYADCVLAFWDGQSHGTAFVMKRCKERGVPLTCYVYALGEWVEMRDNA